MGDRGDYSGYDQDDRLPWLEAVEEDERGPSPVKLILAVLIGLILIGLIVGGLFWLGNRGAAAGNEVALIKNEGEYKIKPTDPGGMEIDNQSSAQVAASEGSEPQGQLDPNRRPEAPVAQPRPAPQPQAPTQPPAQPQAASGPTIQLGAYPSADVANAEWARLTRSYPYLRELRQAVVRVELNGRTFHRLRASGANALALCRRVAAAGGSCIQAP